MDLGEIIQTYSEPIHFGMGMAAAGGLAFLYRMFLDSQPEPGVAYKDGMKSWDIRRFKRGVRVNETAKIVGVKLNGKFSDRYTGSRYCAGRDLEKGERTRGLTIELKFDSTQNMELDFSGDNMMKLEKVLGGDSRTPLEGQKVLVHSWGSEPVALSKLRK